MADPYSFFDKSYAPQVSEAEKQLLSIESLDQAALLVTVSIPAGAPEKAVLNLTGPIVINFEMRVGLQIPQCADGPQQVNMHTLQPVESEDRAAESAVDKAAPQK